MTAPTGEAGELGAFLRQGLVVEVIGGAGVEAQVELVFPAEFEPRRRPPALSSDQVQRVPRAAAINVPYLPPAPARARTS